MACMNANLNLHPRREDIGIATLALGRPDFIVTRESERLTAAMKAELVAYAEFRAIFPASIAVKPGPNSIGCSPP